MDNQDFISVGDTVRVVTKVIDGKIVQQIIVPEIEND